jgi:DNA-binding transcriptional LysR family regulator
MTLQQLKYVVAIADSRSINKAASELSIRQPSISSAVKELEEELGIRIFARSSKGITVTEEGSEFLEYAKAMMNGYHKIEEHYFVQKGK